MGAGCMGGAVSRVPGNSPSHAGCPRETGTSCALLSPNVALPLGRQCICTVLSYRHKDLVCLLHHVPHTSIAGSSKHNALGSPRKAG